LYTYACSEDINSTLKSIPNIQGVSHILCHYLDKKLHVEGNKYAISMTVAVTIKVDDNFRVKEVQEIAKQAKDSIEKIEGVDHADIHLELLACHNIQQNVTNTPK
jgi:divalent metal cation (Fe/Co/Zn/Cd) transporter